MFEDLGAVLGSPLVTNLLAGAAVAVSIYALVRTRAISAHERKVREQEHALAKVQAELGQLQLERTRREAEAASRADVGARFVKLGRHQQKLRIFNKGKAPAQGLEILVPEGGTLLAKNELEAKFPVRSLEPGDSFDLLVSAAMGSPLKMTVELRWNEGDGDSQQRQVHLVR